MKKSIILAVCLCFSSLACSSETSTLILMDIQGGKQKIYLDGNAIDKEKVYAALVAPLTNKGRDSEVNVLFNSNLPFAEIANMKGLLQAVGFLNIKFYSLSDDKKKMAEVEMNKPAILAPILKY